MRAAEQSKLAAGGCRWTARIMGVSDAEIIEVLANVTSNIFTNYLNILARADLDHSLGRFGEINEREKP